MRLKEWYNLRFELRSSHIRETTFARVNTRLVAHVVSRYPTDWVVYPHTPTVLQRQRPSPSVTGWKRTQLDFPMLGNYMQEVNLRPRLGQAWSTRRTSTPSTPHFTRGSNPC